jgi:hypothetical protein
MTTLIDALKQQTPEDVPWGRSALSILNRRIAVTRRYLKRLLKLRDEQMAAAEKRHAAPVMAELILEGQALPPMDEPPQDLPHCRCALPEFVPADDLSQETAVEVDEDAHLAAQAANEDYRFQREQNRRLRAQAAARRISPQQRERDAAHAQRLAEDATEPGREYSDCF